MGLFFDKVAQHKAAENGTFWSVHKLAATLRNTSGQSCEEITISALTQLETCGARPSGRTVWLLNYFSRFFVFLTVINKRFGPFYFLNNVEAKRATPPTLKAGRLCSCDDSPALRRRKVLATVTVKMQILTRVSFHFTTIMWPLNRE